MRQQAISHELPDISEDRQLSTGLLLIWRIPYLLQPSEGNGTHQGIESRSRIYRTQQMQACMHVKIDSECEGSYAELVTALVSCLQAQKHQ